MRNHGNTKMENQRHEHDDATSELRESVMEAGNNLRQAVSSAYPAAREQIGRVSEAVAEQATTLQSTLTDMIREKPIQSILIAAGIGALFGMFSRK